jgi:hypothetical protein
LAPVTVGAMDHDPDFRIKEPKPGRQKLQKRKREFHSFIVFTCKNGIFLLQYLWIFACRTPGLLKKDKK